LRPSASPAGLRRLRCQFRIAARSFRCSRAAWLKIELAIDEEVGTLTGGALCLTALKRDVRRLMR
jgi:hypothetical protein